MPYCLGDLLGDFELPNETDSNSISLYLVINLRRFYEMTKISLNHQNRDKRPILVCDSEGLTKKTLFLTSQDNDKMHKPVRINKCDKDNCDKDFDFFNISYLFNERYSYNVMVRKVSERIFMDETIVKFCGTCEFGLEYCE